MIYTHKEPLTVICYKDKTFCFDAKEGRCVNKACFRYFDDETQKAADKWWGEGGAPVAFSSFWDGCEVRVEVNG